jgi:cold shock CspA family protein/ribosome-associated translation inhibitor RaiA
MQSELHLTFRNIQPSKEIEELIQAEAAKLDSFYSQVMGCHVAVELRHQHRRKGSRYNVTLHLTVPRGEIIVKREPSLAAYIRRLHEGGIKKHAEVNASHKDLRVAITDAFNAARRRLQDFARRQRGDVKTHAPASEARVSKVFEDQGYGFLVTTDGQEIYFHKNSVLRQGFGKLKAGMLVSFVEELGEKGPQASTVRILPKQRPYPSARVKSASA